MTQLYPPILDKTLPAFPVNNQIVVPFTMNPTVSSS
jgi:hypothetical protein